MFTAIAAVDRHWGIGKDGKLLIHIPDDMRQFRQLTEHNIVVMGRKTFESLPGVLQNRLNIVLTTQVYEREEKNLMVVHSEQELFELLEKVKKVPQLFADDIAFDNPVRIYIIGGEQLYESLLPRCDTAYITKVEKEFDADTFFPDLDENEEWTCVKRGADREHNGIIYHFDEYRRTVFP